MSTETILDKAHHCSGIVIKEKSTEEILYVFDQPTTVDFVTNLINPTKEEHVIYEDENHNTLGIKNLVPSMVVFVCKFVPQSKARKRRNIVNVVENTQATPISPTKANHDILI